LFIIQRRGSEVGPHAVKSALLIHYSQRSSRLYAYIYLFFRFSTILKGNGRFYAGLEEFDMPGTGDERAKAHESSIPNQLRDFFFNGQSYEGSSEVRN
jgi:hypothetical protein